MHVQTHTCCKHMLTRKSASSVGDPLSPLRAVAAVAAPVRPREPVLSEPPRVSAGVLSLREPLPGLPAGVPPAVQVVECCNAASSRPAGMGTRMARKASKYLQTRHTMEQVGRQHSTTQTHIRKVMHAWRRCTRSKTGGSNEQVNIRTCTHKSDVDGAIAINNSASDVN